MAAIVATQGHRGGPLSLFGPDSDEELSDDSTQDDQNVQTSSISANDIIKEAPTSLSELLDIVTAQIQRKTEWQAAAVSQEDKDTFVSILTGELSSQYRVIHHQIDDPFLDSTQNKELHRRIIVKIVTAVEDLFTQYSSKAKRLSQRKSLFSYEANMTRLKAQLTVEANTGINIPLMRQRVLDDLRGSLRLRRHLKTPPVPIFHRPDTAERKTQEKQSEDIELLLSQTKMTSKKGISKLRHNINEAVAFGESRRTSPSLPSCDSDNLATEEYSAVEEVTWVPHISRSHSLPDLWQNFILNDLGQRPGPQHITEKKTPHRLWKIMKVNSVESLEDVSTEKDAMKEEGTAPRLGSYTQGQLEQDLCWLVARHVERNVSPNDAAADDELSPLLQAHMHETRKRIIKQAKVKEQVKQAKAKEELKIQPTLDSYEAAPIAPSPCPSDTVYSEYTDVPTNSDLTGSVSHDPADQAASDLNSMSHMASFFEQQQQQQVAMDNPEYIGDDDVVNGTLLGNGQAKMDTILYEHSHPAVVISYLPNDEVVETSDVRVSERVPLHTLKLRPFKPLYNEISGEVTSTMVKEIDQNLRQEREIREVYEEVLKSTPKDHLLFHKDPLVEPSISGTIELSKVLASGTLNHRKKRRILNSKLHHSIPAPWEAEGRRGWEDSQKYSGPTPDDILGKGFTGPVPIEVAPMLRAYNTWVTWWKSTVNVDDYMKYVVKTENDYLGAVYHLYQSDDGDSEEEERKKEEKKHLDAKRKEQKDREEQLAKQLALKHSYSPGKWNVNSVLLGGLGGQPGSVAVESSKAEASSMDPSDGGHQSRLEEVWRRLFFPSHLKMDMAIKYCSLNNKNLPQALVAWEEACELIEQRELLLKQLEQFETDASNPGRHFSGDKAPSSRLCESKHRSCLHKKIDSLDQKTARIVKLVKCQFHDTITYKGRCYQEKMCSDRTEMLYWLQQQRRQIMLQSLNSVTLPPLSMSQVL